MSAFFLLWLAACSSPIGNEYSNVDAIGQVQSWQDWVVVGQFGAPGPFELVDVKYCGVSESCSFSHNGQSHTYEKFFGFELAVLSLEGPGGEVAHVVLRGKEEVADDGSRGRQ